MERKICPRCKQDYLVHVVVKATSGHLIVCPECDAAWFGSQDVNRDAFFALAFYMESHGLSRLWDNLEIQN
jgi:hypothetical protein